jgi:hypothetical protein
VRLLTISLALFLANTGEIEAGPLKFALTGEIYHSTSTDETRFPVGSFVRSEFDANPISYEAAGVQVFNETSGWILAYNVLNAPAIFGIVFASDNHSLIEPERYIDEMIVCIGVASIDRPADVGGHGILFDDPRVYLSTFNFHGIRVRLTGPPSWFDANHGEASILAALPQYESAESWLEFYDFLADARAYSDFNLTKVEFIPEPNGFLLLMAGCVAALPCWAMRRTRDANA